jgi:signal transduction histidine kinase
MSFLRSLVGASNLISRTGRAESCRGRDATRRTSPVPGARHYFRMGANPLVPSVASPTVAVMDGRPGRLAVLRRPGPARDVATAVVTAVVGIVLTIGQPQTLEHLPGLRLGALIGLQLLGAASLLVRRTAPMTVALVAAGLSIVAATPAAAVAAYGVFAYTRHRVWAWAVTVIMLVVTARPWQLHVLRGDDFINVKVQLLCIAALVAAMLGVRNRRVQAREVRLAHQREQLAEQARVEERARLAGEMHDVVTHRVSLMVLQAGALQVSTTDEAVRQQADDLRRSGRQALVELRELLSMIRDATPAAPRRRAEPVALDLVELVDASRGVGVPVELVVRGTAVAMSSVIARTAYRVVQESLTNVRKHAPGATVRLSVDYSGDCLRLGIRNSPGTGADVPAVLPLRSTGSHGGLQGLRQRVELVRGSLRSGAQPDGGFEVYTELPIGAAQ